MKRIFVVLLIILFLTFFLLGGLKKTPIKNSRYYYRNVIGTIYYKESFFNNSWFIRLWGVDKSSFTIIKCANLVTCYAKDKFKVYFTYRVVPNADPVSFEVIEGIQGGYGKDKKAVYYETKILEGADPSSFRFLYKGYAKDNDTVFFHQSIVPEADAATFETVKGENGQMLARDKEYIYKFGKVISHR